MIMGWVTSLSGWLLGLAGLTGVAGIAVLAIVGGPVLPALAKIGQAIGTPIAAAIGDAAGKLFAFEVTGALDMIQTGQRILFVVTCCACTWGYSHHTIWRDIHSNYTLIHKTSQAIRHRR